MNQVGYLGVHVIPNKDGKLVIDQVEDGSPAAQAGLQRGNQLLRMDGMEVADPAQLRELLQARSAGDAIQLTLQRDQKPVEVRVTLAAVSRPMKSDTQRAILGACGLIRRLR